MNVEEMTQRQIALTILHYDGDCSFIGSCVMLSVECPLFPCSSYVRKSRLSSYRAVSHMARLWLIGEQV